MITAPVGFQCPACVAEGAKSAPVYSGAAVAAGAVARRPGGTPYVAYTLIGACVALFLFSYVGGGTNSLAADFGMRPVFIALDDQWYRLITAAFLHWSILHIAFNMLVLVMLGPPLERLLGHVRFTVLYLLAALGGSVASYAFSPINTVSVGASGAIFGLMAALVIAGRQLKVDIKQVAILLGINLVIGFIPGGSIDWRAHLGGLVVGAAVAAVYAYAPSRHKVLIQVVGCLVVAGLLVALTTWRTEQIRAEFRAPVTNAVLTTHGNSTPGVTPRLIHGESVQSGPSNRAVPTKQQ